MRRGVFLACKGAASAGAVSAFIVRVLGACGGSGARAAGSTLASGDKGSGAASGAGPAAVSAAGSAVGSPAAASGAGEGGEAGAGASVGSASGAEALFSAVGASGAGDGAASDCAAGGCCPSGDCAATGAAMSVVAKHANSNAHTRFMRGALFSGVFVVVDFNLQSPGCGS